MRTRRPGVRPGPFTATILAVALLASAPGHAGPWSAGVVQTYGHDTNLLRLADDVAAPDGYSRSDEVLSTSLFAALDQPFGRQRGQAKLNLSRTHFRDNSRFDNDAYAADAGLDWSTAGDLSGTLALGRSRSLSSFDLQEIGLLREKNYEDRRTLESRLRAGAEQALMAELDFDSLDTTNSLSDPSVQRRDFRSEAAAAGLRWRLQGATGIGLFWRESRGTYPRFAVDDSGAFRADRFRVRGADLLLSREASGLSSLDLRLGVSRTRYDLNNARDFSGVTGSLAWTWRPTGKQTWTFNAARDTGQDSTATRLGFVPAATDYSRVSQTLQARVDWYATAKTVFSLGAARVDRMLVQTIAVDGLQFDAGTGRERSDRLALSARWTPFRSAQFGCELARFRQRGTGLGVSLRSSSANCSAQLIVQ